MEVIVKELTSKKAILEACKMTVWKDIENTKEPSEEFMYSIYRSEHSPIRDRLFTIDFIGIKYWVAMHLVRHHVGVTPYVSTQREDRRTCKITSRDDIPQGALVNMRMTVNAQSMIDVSRKRLCNKAHRETRTAWKKAVDALEVLDPMLMLHCVPNCIYKGFCPEQQSCGYIYDKQVQMYREEYARGI